MYCKYCGSHIDIDSIFCSKCGQQLSSQPQIIISEEPKSALKVERAQNLPIVRQPAETPKFDPSYAKETDATGFGLILLSISAFLYFVPKPDIESNELLVLSAIIALALRIIVARWVSDIAERQNRDSFIWGFSAFLFPSFSLIAVGQMRKIYAASKPLVSPLDTSTDLILDSYSEPDLNTIETYEDFKTRINPKVFEELRTLKASLHIYSDEFVTEIVKSYTKSYSIANAWNTANPKLVHDITNGVIKLHALEQLFKKVGYNAVLLEYTERVITESLTHSMPI
ncbi:MAG: zinc ribbon domain-containing protein [Flavobacterium sp.]|nr:MAG: zinc ribbon domain-containing protein [Flavobacterium sp.]